MNEYKITTITSSVSYNTNIGVNMNLYNIANFINIDSVVIGLKYMIKPGKILIRGEYKLSNNTAFYNQISLVLRVNGKLLNVKIFKNASLHITGCKSVNDPENVCKILEKYYAASEKKMININTRLIQKDFPIFVTDDNMLYSNVTKQVFGYIDESGDTWLKSLIQNLVGPQIYEYPQNVPLVIGKEPVTPFKGGYISDTLTNKKNLYNRHGELIGVSNVSLYNNCSKLFKHKNLVMDYSSDTIKVNDKCIGRIVYNYNDGCDYNYNEITPEPDVDGNYSCSMYQRYSTKHHDRNNNNERTVNINCINILYNTGYKINRQTLFNLFEKDGYICIYDPDKYSGVRLNMIVEGTHKITFMIFHSGIVIGSGFKSIESIDTNLQRFVDILSEYKDTIRIC